MYALRLGLQATGYCVGVGCLVFFCLELEQTLTARVSAVCFLLSAVCCAGAGAGARAGDHGRVGSPRFVLFVHARARVSAAGCVRPCQGVPVSTPTRCFAWQHGAADEDGGGSNGDDAGGVATIAAPTVDRVGLMIGCGASM